MLRYLRLCAAQTAPHIGFCSCLDVLPLPCIFLSSLTSAALMIVMVLRLEFYIPDCFVPVCFQSFVLCGCIS